MAKILFCEDNLITQKLIRAALETTPHEIQFASNGSEGIKLIEQARPDIIFTDVHMDEMTGLELLSAVKARAELASIPDAAFGLTASIVAETTKSVTLRPGAQSLMNSFDSSFG